MCWTAIRSSRHGRSGSWRNGRGPAESGRAVRGESLVRCNGRRRPTWSKCSAAAWHACAARSSPVRRRSSPTFLLRWQGVHPDTRTWRQRRLGGGAGSACKDCRCRRKCGSRRCCRRACRAISRAGWTNGSAAARASGCQEEASEPRGRGLRLSSPRNAAQLAAASVPELPALNEDAQFCVLEHLRGRGASFLTDLRWHRAVSRQRVALALWTC